MENTTKAGTFNLVKSRILYGLLLIALTFLMSHVAVNGDCFPVAIALIAYMVSKNTIYIYLVIPAAAGILPYLARGFDPWGDLAALCVCGLLFVAARRIRMELWQKALVAASLSIICTTIYRLATATVYRMEVNDIILEAFIIFCMVFVFEAFYVSMQSAGHLPSRESSQNSDVRYNRGISQGSFSHIHTQLSLTALATVCLLTVCGAGFGFLIWPVIVFISLCGLAYLEIGQTLFMILIMGVLAALVEQAQWGLTVTLLMGAGAAFFARRWGILFSSLVFVAVCRLLTAVESGLVLGADGYTLFIGAAVFLALNWKFGKRIKKFISIFAANGEAVTEETNRQADTMLRKQGDEMEALAELYSTYLDSRSVFAAQFSITQQIIETVRWQIGDSARSSMRVTHDKLDIDVAVSQCAAAGAINGDCCGRQDIGDGRTAMVISDGMGKGKKAATESLLVIKTIMSLLKSGVSADLTLKMINTIMLMKDDEDSFATVDLIIIDKKTGKAKFYKIGAAPTLIRRKSNVEEVKLSAVPLGIVNGLKVRYVETTLKKGDWIIMMSDGVSDGGDGRGDDRSFLPCIKETAANIRSADPQTMCDLVLNQAADSYIGKERDDLTVMVARVL